MNVLCTFGLNPENLFLKVNVHEPHVPNLSRPGAGVDGDDKGTIANVPLGKLWADAIEPIFFGFREGAMWTLPWKLERFVIPRDFAPASNASQHLLQQ